ncbi:MAG: hypothetical protein KGI54_14980 [Pseudomonadota bacterium]|nr:hypothetical protein [Pseudomonadota bacterium]
MPSYNQQQLAYKIRNANAVSIFIGTQLIGFAQSSSPSIDYGTDTYYGVGSAKPQEIQQLRFTNTITLDQLQLSSEGLAFFGIGTPISYILANNQFDIYLLDGASNEAILAYVGSVASTNSTAVTTNQAISEAFSFQAMDVLDPDGNSLLNSNSALLVNFVASSTSTGTPTVA